MKKHLPLSPDLSLFLILIIITGTAAVLLGQDINWDFRSYHFYNAYAFLHHRSTQDLMGGLMQSYLNPVFDVLTYALINLHHAKVTTFILGTVTGINAFLLYKISQEVFFHNRVLNNKTYSLLAVLIGITGAGSISLLGSTTTDTYSACMVLLSFYCYLLSLTEKPARFYFSVSGILIGAVFGLKLTNCVYLFALNFVLLFFEVSVKDFIIYWICCALGFLIADGWWMYQTYMQLGNPMFPYYNNFFHSPYIPRYTFNFSPGFIKLTWYQLLLLPFYLAGDITRFTSEEPLRDARCAIVIVLLLLNVFINKKTFVSNKNFKALIIFFIASYIAWCVIFHVYRYMLSSELLTGILIVGLLQPLFTNKKLFLTALFLVIFLCGISTWPPQWGRKYLGKEYVAVQTPALPDNAVVVLLTRPYTYVIPFFNPKSHFIGLTFIGLGASPQEKNDSLLYKQTIKALRHAAAQHKLYSLGYTKVDLVTTLSYALLFGRKFGPTNECTNFDTNLGDHLQLCKLREFSER